MTHAPISSDTICAPATATGGAIAVIRVAGPRAIAATAALFRPAGGRPLAERPACTQIFGTLVDERGEVLDEVLVSLFRAPHSYTGEDCTEISCHGSRFIVERILSLLFRGGCRMAGAGEFTQRAFLNGKMDLSQAEAVADLIAAESAAAHRVAIRQMRGGFARELETLRGQLLRLTALLELELDFSDHEDLEFADRAELTALAAGTEAHISRLAASFRLGNAMKKGIPVAIVGKTNAGKSTLLNALLGEERAIVSDVHGTTRDVIEDTVRIGDMLFRFIDTAGLRATEDEVERLGIERTLQKLDQADIILLTVDATAAPAQAGEFLRGLLPRCAGKHPIVVYNKCDLAPDFTPVHPDALPPGCQSVAISAKKGLHLDRLRQLLASSVPPAAAGDGTIVTNLRHFEALTHALAAIRRVSEGLAHHLPSDLISQDLRECLYHLAEITQGAITSDEVLHSIFKNFCIGK